MGTIRSLYESEMKGLQGVVSAEAGSDSDNSNQVFRLIPDGPRLVSCKRRLGPRRRTGTSSLPWVGIDSCLPRAESRGQ